MVVKNKKIYIFFYQAFIFYVGYQYTIYNLSTLVTKMTTFKSLICILKRIITAKIKEVDLRHGNPINIWEPSIS